MHYRQLSFIVLLVASSSTVVAQSNLTEFHQLVAKTYDFVPHQLTPEQQKDRSADLDRFWEMVRSSSAIYLPLLRAELRDSAASAFFSYDGSMLLLSLDQDRLDRELAARAIARCDLRDVDHTEYLKTVNSLANEQIDVRSAVYKILEAPSFLAYLPQHGLKLGQAYAFLCAIFPIEDSVLVEDCVSRLATTTNDTTAITLLVALWYSTTQKGFDAIQAVAHNQTHSEVVREFARKQNAEWIEGVAKYKVDRHDESYSAIKAKRRLALRRISDESLVEFETLTTTLRSAFVNQQLALALVSRRTLESENIHLVGRWETNSGPREYVAYDFLDSCRVLWSVRNDSTMIVNLFTAQYSLRQGSQHWEIDIHGFKDQRLKGQTIHGIIETLSNDEFRLECAPSSAGNRPEKFSEGALVFKRRDLPSDK